MVKDLLNNESVWALKDEYTLHMLCMVSSSIHLTLIYLEIQGLIRLDEMLAPQNESPLQDTFRLDKATRTNVALQSTIDFLYSVVECRKNLEHSHLSTHWFSFENKH